jgi:hypothetical protein
VSASLPRLRSQGAGRGGGLKYSSNQVGKCEFARSEPLVAAASAHIVDRWNCEWGSGVSRIIRTKFLYRAAVNELDSGHPFAAGMSISLLQDAVEAMAHEAAALVNASLPTRANFLDHWDAVAKSGAGKQLSYKIEMTELNAARVAFKHLGVSPSVSEAEKQRLAAHRFLAETARAFFDVDFDDISEADLIANVQIQSAVKAAEAALVTGDVTKSLEHSRVALDAVEELMKTAVTVAERNQFGPKIPREVRAAAEDALRWVTRRFTALEKSVALSVLRVNPADYWFLYQTLPGRTIEGGFYWTPSISTISTRTPERARACVRIIIDLAQRVERVHADWQRLVVQSGVAEEERLLKEWQDRLLNQPIPYQPPPDASGS